MAPKNRLGRKAGYGTMMETDTFTVIVKEKES